MSAPPPLPGVEHRHVDAGGLRMHIAEAGEGEGRRDPILLVHGWPQHHYEWRGVIPLLTAAGRRVIAPDLRGFGWTDAPPGPVSAEVFATDLAALLDALELDRVDVVGHDWGGFSSFLLALDHPTRVRRLLALSTPHPFASMSLPLALESWRAWYTLPMAAGLARVRPETLGWLLRREGVGRADAEIYVAPLREAARASVTERLYRSYLRTVVETIRGGNRPPRLTVPTRLLVGDRDVAIPRSGLGGFQAHADDLEVEMIPGRGHFIVDADPALVAARTLAHFAA